MIKTRAQSLSEYSLFLAIVLIAIVAMNVYVKRGLQGRYADVADSTISTLRAKAGANISVPSQYEPYYVSSEVTTNAPQKIDEEIVKGGAVARVLAPNSTLVSGENIEGTNIEE